MKRLNLVSLFVSTASAAALCANASSATASDFVDTRVVFIAGDDDFMHFAGETLPTSQNADVGDRPGYTEFFDELDNSESGRESRTTLVLHKKADGYWPGVTTEAAVVLELNHARVLSSDPRALQDDGSYLRVEAQRTTGKFGVVLMPFRSDRLRLGHTWDITWGGDRAFPSTQPVPGFKLSWDSALWGVYAGGKTTRMPYATGDDDPRNGQLEAFWAGFGGARLGRESSGLRLDLGGGYFDKGTNPNGAVRGEAVTSGGASARVAYIDGLPYTETNDTRLYTADPTRPWTSWEGVQADARDWRAAVEATWVGQVLEDPERVGGTTVEAGLAGAASGDVRLGFTQLGAVGLYRDLGFIYFNGPGVVRRYQAMPDDLETTPEVTAAFTARHHLPALHLTPSLQVGVTQPAAASNLVPSAGIHAPGALTGRRTVVYRRADIFDDNGLVAPMILPAGTDVLPTFGVRLATDLELAPGFAVTAQLTATHDRNQTQLAQDLLQVNDVRTFTDPLSLGAALMARAEF